MVVRPKKLRYAGPYWKDFCLLQVAPQVGRLELQQFDWYSDGYEKGYQGIIGVVEIPNDDLLIISVQRDSHSVLTSLGSRIAARFTNVGLSTDLPELHGQAPRSAEFKP
jgi:hypothetical protein